MTMENPWKHLRYGNADEGIKILRDAHSHALLPTHIMELGVAYLWIGDYHAASEHFQQAIKREPLLHTAYYAMAGVAFWCIEQPGAAVRIWHAGLGAHFSEGAGGIQLPLLMLAASILRPGSFSKEEAATIVKERIEDPVRKSWLKNWPGRLAEFALGLTDKAGVTQQSRSKREDETRYRQWQADFYVNVIEYGRGNIAEMELKEAMQRISDISRPEWSEERGFLSLLWSKEFFIARYEASLDPRRWAELLRGAVVPPWQKQ